MKGTAATYWEGYFGSSGELLRLKGRIPRNIGDVYIIIIGKLVAAKRRDVVTYREVCCDKRGESLGTMGIYTTEQHKRLLCQKREYAATYREVCGDK
jgi:hypothetical protein